MAGYLFYHVATELMEILGRDSLPPEASLALLSFISGTVLGGILAPIGPLVAPDAPTVPADFAEKLVEELSKLARNAEK